MRLSKLALTLCAVSFLGFNQKTDSQTGRLKIEILDARSGAPAAARAYLVDESGASFYPADAIRYDKNAEHHFIVSGSAQLTLPGGRYTLRIERGPEFLPWTSPVAVAAGQGQNVIARLQRWIDMNRLGWFSADLHNHRKPDEMPALLAAEDLNLAPTLADWIWEDRPRSTPPQTSNPIRQVDPFHSYSVLDKEVERLERGPGAVDLLGLRAPILFDGYRFYPPDDVYCTQAHAQGGYVDAEKITWRDTAALVALGHVDFAGIVHNHFNRNGVELETDRWGMIPKWRTEFNTPQGMPFWSMEVYYHFLNCGFRLPVSAGSASGVKASPLGYNRVYVSLQEPFSYASWFASLKAGRSFGTNGPMLFFTVDGRQPGSTLKLDRKGRKVRVRAESLSAGRLQQLDIVQDGKVIRTAAVESKKHTLEFDLPVQKSGWISARCFEVPDQTVRFAHSSPIYLDLGDPAPAPEEDVRFFLDWMDREIEFYKQESGFREPAHRAAMLSLFQRARAVFAGLRSEKRLNRKER
jgi:hypothetical protein